jgi:hypothetical protein
MEFELTRRSLLFSLLSAAGAVAKSREDPVFPNWTNDFVDRMLSDSPWAKQLTVSFELQPEHLESRSQFLDTGRLGRTQPSEPVQHGGARTEIYLTTRWASALPIRQATALQDFGAQHLESPEAVELLTREDPEYVLEIAGFPTSLFKRGAQRLEDALTKTATLCVPGRPPLSPASVRVPEHGMHLMGTLRFPRFQNLTPNEGSIELAASIGAIRIQQVFKLKPMVYKSRLEL